MDETEKFIRQCVERRLTQQQIADLLGVTKHKFGLLLESITPPIEWADRHSISCQDARIACGEARRGTEKTVAACRKAREAQAAKRAPHTAFGVTGQLRELVERFGVVNQQSVRIRMQNGMPIEEALTTPRQDKNNLVEGRRKGRETIRRMLHQQYLIAEERRQYLANKQRSN